VPANNSVIEPELWSALPPDVAAYATRLLVKGRLTPELVRAMERQVAAAVETISATGVDVIAYCDMVTTFLVEQGWTETTVARIRRDTAVPAITAWTALRAGLAALDISAFALATPYPAAIHKLARPFFTERGFVVVDDATLDIEAVSEVPTVGSDRLFALVDGLRRERAQALVLLATDLPTFRVIEALEHRLSLPVLTSNQTLLWQALRTIGRADRIARLGRLFHL
jgi:maleate isomerase